MTLFKAFTNWLEGWRKHKSCYIDEAISRRGLKGVKVYMKDTNIKLTYKDRQIVFSATPQPWPKEESVETYIQKHVDEVSGKDWTFKYRDIMDTTAE